MGQKVSPVGLRIGINKDWESKWYAGNKDFSKFLLNDNKIRKFLLKKFKNAGIANIVIERNSKRTEVLLILLLKEILRELKYSLMLAVQD